MKRKFIKILPIAVAVLFATSCSKDDVDNTVKTPQEIVQENVDNTINDNVETPQEIVQENVDNTINNNVETPQEIVQENDDNTVKTITITGKVSQESLSKVSLVVEDGVTTNNLKFDGNEIFEFNDEGNKVWGKITINDQDGNYTAKLYFKGEGGNLVGPVFTASKGSNPESISSRYSSLDDAVKDACYTIKFMVKRVENAVPATGYTYQMYTSDVKEDLVVNIASAFIKAETSKTIIIDMGEYYEQPNVINGYYYVLSTSVKMGKNAKDIVAGKIYKVTE